MPNWVSVLEEINKCQPSPNRELEAVDIVRRRYLLKLHEKTKRNIIAYYSGWLQVGNAVGTDLNDMDINGFMTTIHGLDCTQGLDLILHTPGGSISATEQIVYYLKSKFGNDVRAVIPQIAMSAGTMISCSCKQILMGRQSCLGPFDPQIYGVSAMRVQEEFNKAVEEAKKEPASIPYWQVIIGKYHPTFLNSCKLACDRAKHLVTQWLSTNMFNDKRESLKISRNIVNNFNKIGHKLDHDRHVSISECENFGLKILRLEDDQELQDLVLTVHHTFMHTFSNVPLVKAIENHKGVGMFLSKRS
ncbi:MAG: hypothetical protein IJS54_00070 [Desulfovibrio sp.]|nr:hypothetical protein [Desulfovibrio sp.]